MRLASSACAHAVRSMVSFKSSGQRTEIVAFLRQGANSPGKEDAFRRGSECLGEERPTALKQIRRSWRHTVAVKPDSDTAMSAPINLAFLKVCFFAAVEAIQKSGELRSTPWASIRFLWALRASSQLFYSLHHQAMASPWALQDLRFLLRGRSGFPSQELLPGMGGHHLPKSA